ncbi:hypothetical protein GBAR_LOCUS30237 [Geodia barretti]|uniref:Uncharacterized protein n=1 Tax=Geodia barretti TaxID=519541 RepID=A0AA35TW81_GEOBA|nr:hypothetical protein GBAR_LOCUS30237 [Geodia barretti]
MKGVVRMAGCPVLHALVAECFGNLIPVTLLVHCTLQL